MSQAKAKPAPTTEAMNEALLARRRFLIGVGTTAAAVTLLPDPLANALDLVTPSNAAANPDPRPGSSSSIDSNPDSKPDPNPDSKPDLKSDPRRPQFHLLPAKNWMNDPNGPIYWKGSYHMFFQYNPNAAVWGDMHWYHSISPDMIHWKHLPIALAPTPGGPDADGCFSGTAVIRNGVATFIYTGVAKSPREEATLIDDKNAFRETQMYATSTDAELLHWDKRATPVIATPPKNLAVTGFRDPAPWLQSDGQPEATWYMAVGSGVKGQGGAILLYKSPDLQSWEYQHMLTSYAATSNGQPTGAAANGSVDPVATGDMWECPDFFALNGKHVLIYSTQGKVLWQTGTLDTREMLFHPEQSGILDYGSFYAPKTQLDKAGNRILWGWIQEKRPDSELIAAGWAGLISLPRVLTVGADGRLNIAADPGIGKLRRTEQKLHLTAVKSSGLSGKESLSSPHLQNACGELLFEIKPTSESGSEPFTLDLISPAIETATTASAPADAGPDKTGDDETTTAAPPSYLSIRYSHANPKELVIDQQRLPINVTQGQPLTLHFYIDGSVIELFINNQITTTKRFYYPGQKAPDLSLSFTGNKSNITRLSQWQLTPISKDRLTT